MIDDLVRDLQVLWKADSVIAKIWLHIVARRFGLFALAGLIATFALGMGNVAAFYGLAPAWGAAWAAAMVAVADLVIAGFVLLLGRNARPGPEMELALDLRKMAVESVQEDARDLKLTVSAVGQEIRQTRDSIAGLIHHPFDAATEKLLIPAALSLIRGLRAKKKSP
jgi:hypothetical protein